MPLHHGHVRYDGIEQEVNLPQPGMHVSLPQHLHHGSCGDCSKHTYNAESMHHKLEGQDITHGMGSTIVVEQGSHPHVSHNQANVDSDGNLPEF